jgi:hypothetical protein
MSHLDIYPTIFESFNARALEPEQVAKTFVPPERFDDALVRAHTLIVGPRGSGKTTILKMMQSPALESWADPRAEYYRASVDFTGVFIPADRSWSEQIGAVGEDKLSIEHKQLLGISAFTTHVLKALVEAMEYKVHPPSDQSLVPHRRVTLSRSEEADLVIEIAQKWYLTLRVPSLVALKHSLSARLSEIWEISSSEALRDEDGRGQRLSEIKHLQLNFLTSAGIAIELFNDATNQKTAKWGLLFDELELAPQWIREQLVKSLRSVNNKLLFKLSMSPYSQDAELLHDELSATFGNDYNQVALWYAYKENSYAFCEELFQSLLKDNGLEKSSPTRLLGKSNFELLDDDAYRTSPAYMPGSPLQQQFSAMARKDRTFRRFLQSKQLDLDKLHLLTEDRRAAEIRKITSLIAVREAYRVSDQKSAVRQQERGRKNRAVYRGALSLFTMVEGNPRWFIGVIGKLIHDYAKEHRKLTTARQSEEVDKAVNRFRAYLKTIPCPSLMKNQPPRGVLSLLDLVGKFFGNAVIKQDFNPDPPLTFDVDSRTSDTLMESLGRALNAGAIVYVNEPDSDLLLNSLRGKRFRLSYLLAPYYRIPLILGRSISLKTILSGKVETEQSSLFGQEESK